MTTPVVAQLDPHSIQALFDRQLPTALALRTSRAFERVAKLQRFKDALLRHRETFHAALYADLRKPPVEADLTELLPVVDEARHAMVHLSQWMRPKKIGATLTTLGTSAKVVYQPRGRCLIIGPWNYPVNTLLSPLVSAVAAGNTVILKPSEMTPHVNAVVADLVAEVFDPTEVAFVQGGVEISQQLLALPFDHIFFTGSTAIGKVVMSAAALNLASVTLELGGKSPVIVDETADLERAAEMIIWGKLTNSGQSCVAPDHVFVHRSVSQHFLHLCKSVIDARYGATDRAVAVNPDFGRMITCQHAERVAMLVDEAVACGATVLAGGSYDVADRFVAPTLLTDVPAHARISSEEIFGPVLPIETFDAIEDVVRGVNAMPKPLALYLWTECASSAAMFIEQTSSGGVCVNHCMQQYAHSGLPFGGVNHSGIGNSHGHYGFRAFSHERAVLASGPLNALSLFFPPYTKPKVGLSKNLLNAFKWI